MPPDWANAGVIGVRARAPSMVGNARPSGALEGGAERGSGAREISYEVLSPMVVRQA